MMDESDVGRALNREYYETLTAGRDDYWRKMAAPRHRVAEIAAILERANRVQPQASPRDGVALSRFGGIAATVH
jgi:DNA-binding response OmpR family regulator